MQRNKCVANSSRLILNMYMGQGWIFFLNNEFIDFILIYRQIMWKRVTQFYFTGFNNLFDSEKAWLHFKDPG